MTTEKLYFRVPYNKGHSHFADTIDSFPDLPSAPSFEAKQKYQRQMIRYQLMNTSRQQASRIVTLRECFKFDEKRDVEFCLQNKLPGTSVVQAAKELGLRK